MAASSPTWEAVQETAGSVFWALESIGVAEWVDMASPLVSTVPLFAPLVAGWYVWKRVADLLKIEKKIIRNSLILGWSIAWTSSLSPFLIAGWVIDLWWKYRKGIWEGCKKTGKECKKVWKSIKKNRIRRKAKNRNTW